jgi:hypothetical protein
MKKSIALLSLSLFLDDMLGCILGSFLYVLTSMAGSGFPHWASVLVMIIIVLITWAMLYGTGWHDGQKDRNKVKYGHMKKSMLKPLLAGLIASIPLVAVYILYVTHIGITDKNPLYYIIYLVFNLPYLTFVVDFRYNTMLLLILFLPIPLVTLAGYELGFRNLSVSEKIVYTKKKPAKKETKSGYIK